MNPERSFVKTKEAILIFISKFIKLMEKKIQDYALDIKVRLTLELFTYQQGYMLQCFSARAIQYCKDSNLQTNVQNIRAKASTARWRETGNSRNG